MTVPQEAGPRTPQQPPTVVPREAGPSPPSADPTVSGAPQPTAATRPALTADEILGYLSSTLVEQVGLTSVKDPSQLRLDEAHTAAITVCHDRSSACRYQIVTEARSRRTLELFPFDSVDAFPGDLRALASGGQSPLFGKSAFRLDAGELEKIRGWSDSQPAGGVGGGAPASPQAAGLQVSAQDIAEGVDATRGESPLAGGDDARLAGGLFKSEAGQRLFRDPECAILALMGAQDRGRPWHESLQRDFLNRFGGLITRGEVADILREARPSVPAPPKGSSVDELFHRMGVSDFDEFSSGIFGDFSNVAARLNLEPPNANQVIAEKRSRLSFEHRPRISPTGEEVASAVEYARVHSPLPRGRVRKRGKTPDKIGRFLTSAGMLQDPWLYAVGLSHSGRSLPQFHKRFRELLAYGHLKESFLTEVRNPAGGKKEGNFWQQVRDHYRLAASRVTPTEAALTTFLGWENSAVEYTDGQGQTQSTSHGMLPAGDYPAQKYVYDFLSQAREAGATDWRVVPLAEEREAKPAGKKPGRLRFLKRLPLKFFPRLKFKLLKRPKLRFLRRGRKQDTDETDGKTKKK